MPELTREHPRVETATRVDPTDLVAVGEQVLEQDVPAHTPVAAVRRDVGGHDVLGGTAIPATVSAALRRRRGQGTPLSDSTAASLGGAFGADLGGVRVHTDAEADRLSTAVQATAFTVGSDIYFRGGTYAPGTAAGDRLLAHEIAHTLQAPGGSGPVIGRADDPAEADADQMADRALRRVPAARELSATPAAVPGTDGVIRRFVSAKDFDAMTAEGRFTGASTAQKSIRKWLKDYRKLAVAAPDPGVKVSRSQRKEAKKELRDTTAVVPTEKIDQALLLLAAMEQAVNGWFGKHTVTDDGGVDDGQPAGTPTTRFDPSRRKRMDGLSRFYVMLLEEQQRLLTTKAVAEEQGVGQTATTEVAGLGALQKHYSGGFTSIFAQLGPALDLVVPERGDSASFEISFEVPIPDTPVAIGGMLEVKAARSKDNKSFSAGIKIAPTVSVGVSLAQVKAALGGYAEVSAKSAAQAMTLISYVLYRSARQSNLPAELSTAIWAGGVSRYHELKADAWSRDVEKEAWGSADAEDDDDTWIEFGAELAGSAKVGKAGLLEAKTAGAVRGGTRYDRTSMENRKGGAGKRNKRSDRWYNQFAPEGRGAEKSLGRATYSVSLSQSVTAGLVSGTLEGTVTLRQQGLHKAQRKGVDNWVVESATITGSGEVTTVGPGMAGLLHKAAGELLSSVHPMLERTTRQATPPADDNGQVGQVSDVAQSVNTLAAVPPPGPDVFRQAASLVDVGAAVGIGLEVEAEVTKAAGKPAEASVGLAVSTKSSTSLSLDYVSAAVARSRHLIGVTWSSGKPSWKEGISWQL